MSENPENFEKLQRIMKVKRFEQPPPGYFDRFSSQVLRKIEKRETEMTEAPWLARLFASLERNPIFASAFGVALCGTLIAAVAYSSYTPAPTETNFLGSIGNGLNVADSTTSASKATTGLSIATQPTISSTAPLFNTNLAAAFPGGAQNEFEPVGFATSH